MAGRRAAAGRGLGYRHPRVQRLRRLVSRRSAREEERRFVIEGPNLLEEAFRAGTAVETVFVPAGASTVRVAALVERCFDRGARVFELEPGVLERVAGTVSPQPVMAVCEMPAIGLLQARSVARDLVVVLLDVRDPGNAGTVVRSAWAAGAGAVLCSDGTVDMWNPKALRSSAGAVMHLPVVAAGPVGTALDELGEWGFKRWGAVPSGGAVYDGADLTLPSAFVVGNESGGLPVGQLLPQLDGLLTIPMPGGAESLNVGAATAVLCFEAARQRRCVAISRPGAPRDGKLARP